MQECTKLRHSSVQFIPSQKGHTNDLVKILGCFYQYSLLIGPHATNCHCQLSTSFRLGNTHTSDQETICSEEYLTFLDDLRRNFSFLVQPNLFIPDTNYFLVDSPASHSCPLLHEVFLQVYLCLDESFHSLPAVKFGSVDSDNPTSSLLDVILPVQSYFYNISHRVEAVTTEQSVAEFLQLDTNFGGSVMSDMYFPWGSVDVFGRNKVLE